MKNFKFIIVTCLILSMLAMLIACGDNEEDTADSSDASGEASVTESSDSTEKSESTESSESTNESGAPAFDNNADDIIYDIF